MAQLSQVASDFNRNGLDFLKVEVQTGLTFAGIALGEEPGSAQRERNRLNARKAYDTVLGLRPRFEVPQDTAGRKIDEGLQRLRSALERLGEDFA